MLKRVADTEAKWHGGAVTFDTIRKAIAWLTQCDALYLADGVPLRFDGPFDQTVDGPAFPRVESFYKPRLQFDPGGASNLSWAQRGLEEVGPYDRESFARKKLRIAVMCEAGYRRSMEAAVHGLLKGLPHIRSSGPNSLAPHRTGLVGRFRLEEPEVPRKGTAAPTTPMRPAPPTPTLPAGTSGGISPCCRSRVSGRTVRTTTAPIGWVRQRSSSRER